MRTVSVVHSAEQLGGLFSPESHRMPFHNKMSSPVLLFKCDIPILTIHQQRCTETQHAKSYLSQLLASMLALRILTLVR